MSNKSKAPTLNDDHTRTLRGELNAVLQRYAKNRVNLASEYARKALIDDIIIVYVNTQNIDDVHETK